MLVKEVFVSWLCFKDDDVHVCITSFVVGAVKLFKYDVFFMNLFFSPRDKPKTLNIPALPKTTGGFMGKILQKRGVNAFLSSLLKKGSLFAPVKTDMVRFQQIKTPREFSLIDYHGHAFFPPKKYLLPNEEDILLIRKGATVEKKQKLPRQFVFNVRLCDLNAIAILDKLYLDPEHPDPYYEAKREATVFIGLNCEKEIDEYCFCGSMNLQREYDLLLHDRGSYYYVDVRSEKGLSLVKHLPDAEPFTPPLPVTSKVLEHKDLWQFFADKWWEGDTNLCVGCQRCTLLCPTCFCFDIKDEVDLSDLRSGRRMRIIDSCHSPDFTRVAGGHDFRKSRLQRYRHRVMHKLQYFKDAFHRSMCTGCGRCIRYCHSKIDFVKTINEEFIP